jgi:2-hydroxy-6-oxo-6-(2'-carboxyphenyl)-hexa-2,4-dienoate hydrolase
MLRRWGFLLLKGGKAMIKKKHCICLGLILTILVSSPHLFAQDCTIDSNTLDRGEKKEFIVCGEIPENYILTGLSETGINLEYHQYLTTCAVGSKKPGIFFVLSAEKNATTTSLTILNSATQEPVCEEITIEVPERVLIPDASFVGQSYPNRFDLPYLILKINADTPNDLSETCGEGLSFPQGKWPKFSMLSWKDLKWGVSDEQIIFCGESSILALLKVQGQQRGPAKIIIPKMKVGVGVEREGVTYASIPPPPWIDDMKDGDAKYIDVSGYRTRYFEKGRGDAMLLVHGGQAGGTSNAQSWQQNFEYLSRYFHVYALDKIGSGFTDNPKTENEWQNYYSLVVDHIVQFMKSVGIEKVHLIGQSQGGWPVTRIALDHPEMVLSVVNMDSGMAPDEYLAGVIEWMIYMAAFVIPTKGNPTPQSLKKELELWSYSMNNIIDERVQRDYEITQFPKIIEAKEQMEKYSLNPAHESWIALKEQAFQDIRDGMLKVPSLVIWGYDDPAMPYESGVALYEFMTSNSDIPGSQLVVFDECGHSPYVEYPELFNTLIRHFCGAFSLPPIR